MARISLNQTFLGTVFVAVSLFLSGCASSASSRYFGSTAAPSDKVLRYISGSEPESLDPQVPTGQPKPAF
jgi:ABC-type oligopeptide transport system substrate-binding subunit